MVPSKTTPTTAADQAAATTTAASQVVAAAAATVATVATASSNGKMVALDATKIIDKAKAAEVLTAPGAAVAATAAVGEDNQPLIATITNLPSPIPEGQEYIRTADDEKSVSGFINKTYSLVSDPSVDDIIAWSPTGTSFVVHAFKRLEAECLPRWFKHKNFASFVRQLNMYGFSKVGNPQHWEFYHDYFLRGQTGILRHIKRRRATSSRSSAATAKATKSLNEEITTLKRQRDELNTDVSELRTRQAAMTAQLEACLAENKRLMAELAAARQTNSTMQTTFDSILGVVSEVFPSASVADDIALATLNHNTATAAAASANAALEHELATESEAPPAKRRKGNSGGSIPAASPALARGDITVSSDFSSPAFGSSSAAASAVAAAAAAAAAGSSTSMTPAAASASPATAARSHAAAARATSGLRVETNPADTAAANAVGASPGTVAAAAAGCSNTATSPSASSSRATSGTARPDLSTPTALAPATTFSLKAQQKAMTAPSAGLKVEVGAGDLYVVPNGSDPHASDFNETDLMDLLKDVAPASADTMTSPRAIPGLDDINSFLADILKED